MDQYHIYAQISKGREGRYILYIYIYSQFYSCNNTVTSYKARKKKSIGYVTARSYEKRLLSRVRNAVLLINDMVHPNVVKFHNWYETRNHIWVVEEYCVGGNLRTVRSQDAYEPETSVRRFGVDLMAGLRYVHGRGIIHCDLKPSRILVNEYGVLKLTGFDIARRVTETKGRNQRGSTPHYMAPELIREKNDPPYSYKSDLWALGCILYEMYFGEPPFVAGTISDLNKSIVYDAPRFEHVRLLLRSLSLFLSNTHVHTLHTPTHTIRYRNLDVEVEENRQNQVQLNNLHQSILCHFCVVCWRRMSRNVLIGTRY